MKYVFIAGVISLAGVCLTGITLLALMMGHVIAFGPPPDFLFIWIAVTAWLLVVGGGWTIWEIYRD